jgi:exodeoxyribonuclease-3
VEEQPIFALLARRYKTSLIRKSIMKLKIATWNINSINIRINDLIDFIGQHNPDVICLQELKCETSKFPYELLSHLPYNLYINGQKSYNGVAILSKIPADEVKTDFSGNLLSDQARFIEICFNSFMGFTRVISLYAPNGGGEVGSDKLQMKLKFYDQFINYINSLVSYDEKLFIGADYNIAPFDIDVYDPDNLQDTTCFTIVEKARMRKMLNSGFVDNFRIIHPEKKEFSWWDYRAGAFEQNKGMRIDSILSSSNALPFLKDCFIDYQTRTQSKPSDHAPVIAIYE